MVWIVIYLSNRRQYDTVDGITESERTNRPLEMLALSSVEIVAAGIVGNEYCFPSVRPIYVQWIAAFPYLS